MIVPTFPGIALSHAFLPSWQRVVFALLTSAGVVLGAGRSWATIEEPTAALERGVKAAYLYKFLGYVEWPSTMFVQPESPLIIGVVGADEIASELASVVASRSVNNRPVQVRRLKENDAPVGLHMLFVGRSEQSHIAQLALAAQQQPHPPVIVTNRRARSTWAA